MSRKILNGPGFCAVVENDRLVEYIPKDDGDQSGDILLGRIDRMMPGLGCAFADVGRKKNGFLPLREESSSFTGGDAHSGETLVLQIKKEETGTKGVFLTRDITLPGRFVILMPMNRYIGVSSRLGDEEQRNVLKHLGGEIAGNRFGLILRNAAADAGERQIREETEQLLYLWQEILRNKSGGKPGTILRHGDVAGQLRDDYLHRGVDEILEVGELGQELSLQLRRAAERTISLSRGGNIVIDRCEAMTVIDVNTASYTGSGFKERTVLETNLEACAAVAEQVRLRNLSGIILIDFIDMDNEKDRDTVAGRLAECFEPDRIRKVIHGWTSLGLMEMTRRRTRPCLDEVLCEPCPACGGRGYKLRER